MADQPSPPAWLEKEASFIEHVIKICDTPQGLADLRTGLTPGELEGPWRMMPHLAKMLPYDRTDQDAYLSVAAWYAGQSANPRTRRGGDLPPAWQPGRGNLGWSAAQAVARHHLAADSAAKRLQLITRKRSGDAAMRATLSPMLRRLTSENIPVCWPWLLRDMTRWRKWPADVTREWMNAFYDPDHHTLKATSEES